MRTADELLDSVDLDAVAGTVTSKPLDHFPPLISYECLTDAAALLKSQSLSSSAGGLPPSVETLAMPKRGLGPRPVAIADPVTRVTFEGLVERMKPLLEPLSRRNGAWQVFDEFGLDGDSTYIVQIDVASCYEYVEHELIQMDLLRRGIDNRSATATVQLLGEWFGRPRGLPQMLESSDRLADSFLSIIERRLLRDNLALLRYVDDFRVLAETWDAANQIVEDAADYSREVGLTLSSEKTAIFRRDTLLNRKANEQAELDQYVEHVKETAVIADVFFGGPYGEHEIEIERSPEEEEARHIATWNMLSDWFGQHRLAPPDQHPPESFVSRKVPQVLSILRSYDDHRVGDDILREIVFRQPQRIEQVCSYLIYREEHHTYSPFVGHGGVAMEDGWQTLRTLSESGRQSPWAKCWILHTANELRSTNSDAAAAVRHWVQEQLGDRHELVRAQAAWVAARFGSLPSERLAKLYQDASALTTHALAAAAGRQHLAGQIAKSIVGDGPLNKAAFEWGENAERADAD